MSLNFKLAACNHLPFALKLAFYWSTVATHWESASTGDIRSALVWHILPAARAVISVDAMAAPQRTLSAKTGQNIPAVVERVAVTPSSGSRTTSSEEAYPVCMTSVWSASGVIENRIAAARNSQACAAPPAETDSTGSDTSRAARSQPANVAPISYVLR